jgi:hypothetical protein
MKNFHHTSQLLSAGSESKRYTEPAEVPRSSLFVGYKILLLTLCFRVGVYAELSRSMVDNILLYKKELNKFSKEYIYGEKDHLF